MILRNIQLVKNLKTFSYNPKLDHEQVKNKNKCSEGYLIIAFLFFYSYNSNNNNKFTVKKKIKIFKNQQNYIMAQDIKIKKDYLCS